MKLNRKNSKVCTVCRSVYIYIFWPPVFWELVKMGFGAHCCGLQPVQIYKNIREGNGSLSASGLFVLSWDPDCVEVDVENKEHKSKGK